MTHAVAEAVVLVEQLRIFPSADGYVGLQCPDEFCSILSGENNATLGALLTAARRHVLEDHAGGERLDHEHAYTAVLQAVDATEGDPYPALIPEPRMADERPGRAGTNRCEACHRTVRGPLLPLFRADRDIQLVGPGCFKAHRRNVSHVADPLPMPPNEEGADHA